MGSLYITETNATSLSGFSSLTTISSSFSVQTNALLTDVSLLEDLSGFIGTGGFYNNATVLGCAIFEVQDAHMATVSQSANLVCAGMCSGVLCL